MPSTADDFAEHTELTSASEVGYMEKNTQAGQFWNAVVAEYTGGNFIHVPVRCAPDADPTPGLHFTSG
jgi:hypothetical protein